MSNSNNIKEVATPRCEAERFEALEGSAIRRDCVKLNFARHLERELAASQAEVERLKKELAAWDYGTRAAREQKRAEKAEAELLQSQDINSFLDTEFRIATKRAEKAESEVERLRTENVCLQELLQEFYEWSRRDFPTEAEVREIMNRYYDLLNK